MSNIKNINIDSYALYQIEKHAKESFPHECCGFFFGSEDHTYGNKATSIMEIKNEAPENLERRFVVNPKDYMKAEKHADQNDLVLLGVYHTHPKHPAVPSELDLKQALPNFSYIILSVFEDGVKEVTSWRLNDEKQFEQETINKS